ncbi:activating transcription factor 7-interacting 2-like isoform X1 [Labeo rohita]|uniref:Activating transcription factor 7-interacting 2-like isoform X1 n=1 Tax=Labeo rohita TaxID=84645 RepID=A0A498N0R4_LABRO|nr:activating transcription factor 7-interacting 2-like isoform X1 [Labeo rohita]
MVQGLLELAIHVEKIIADKVVTAVEQSDYKMKNLMERINEVNSEPKYDARIQKLEAHVRKIKRRGDAVFAYIRKFRSLGSSQSQRSKNPVVDLTEEDRAARLKEESLVTQELDQQLEPSSKLKQPSSTPPVAIKEENQSVPEEDRVSSSVQLEEEAWHSKLPPFPDTPFPKELPVVAASHNLPQKPVVKLARIGSAQELGIAWNVDRKDPHAAEMDCYYIYVSHEHKNGTFSGWKCLGEIKAMALPMACKVSDCKGDKRLCFIVVGKDVFGRYGPYSDIRTVAP